MRLNIGCGEHYADGWINTDLHDKGPKPDVQCSLLHLPFSDGSAEMVYLGHVLEHIDVRDVRDAIREVYRVIADDGRLMVVGPDVGLTEIHEPILMDGVIYGGRRWPGDEHRWLSSGDATLPFVIELFDASLIPVADVGVEWPIVDRAPWQFAIEARPRRS